MATIYEVGMDEIVSLLPQRLQRAFADIIAHAKRLDTRCGVQQLELISNGRRIEQLEEQLASLHAQLPDWTNVEQALPSEPTEEPWQVYDCLVDDYGTVRRMTLWYICRNWYSSSGLATTNVTDRVIAWREFVQPNLPEDNSV